MNRFKTLFLIVLSINILAIIPLVLVLINPEMLEVMDYSKLVMRVSSYSDGKLSEIYFKPKMDYLIIALSMIVALIVSLRIKVKESAQTAALILGIIHLLWFLLDIRKIFQVTHNASGSISHLIPITILSLIAVLVLFHAWKKAEI